MPVKIQTLKQVNDLEKFYASMNKKMPADLQKAIAEFKSKASHQTMPSETAKEVLKVDPNNAAAQEALSVAHAGFEQKDIDHVTRYTDPTPGGKYKFNWQQYAFRDKPELANARELTPAQVDEIDKARLETMHDATDNVNLDNIATNMHFKYANEKWSDFVKSDRFAQFKNYLDDVQQYQKDKALDQIWDDGSVANVVTDFVAPVSKEYAKNHYNEINGLGDMAAPLAADAVMNATMAGSSKIAAPIAKLGRPIVSKVTEYAVAPTIGEVGQVLVNDKDLGSAALDAFAGTGANYAVPSIMKGLYGKFTHGADIAVNKPWRTQAQKAIDDAVVEAKAARAAQKNTLTKNPETGFVLDTDTKIEYVKPEVLAKLDAHPLADRGWRYESNVNMPNKPINVIAEDKSNIFLPEAEARDVALLNIKAVKGAKNKAKAVKTNVEKILTRNKATPNESYKPKVRPDEVYASMPKDLGAYLKSADERQLNAFNDRVSKIQEGRISAADWQDNYNATQAAYQYLGIKPRESLVSYLNRQKGIGVEYLSNLYGTSPRAKRYFKNTQYMLPDGMYNAEEEKKKAAQDQQATTYKLLLRR